MATDYNPGYPNMFGIQWPVTKSGVAPISARSQAQGFRRTAETTETLLDVNFDLVAPARGSGYYGMEVFAFGNESIVGLTETVYRPGSSTDGAGVWVPNDGVSALWQMCDGPIGDPLGGANFMLIAPEDNGSVGFQFTGAGGFAASRRVAYVRLRVRGKGGTVLVLPTENGIPKLDSARRLSFATDSSEIGETQWGEVLWGTGFPLCTAIIAAFGVGSTFAIQVTSLAHSNQLSIGAIELVIGHYPENRSTLGVVEVLDGQVSVAPAFINPQTYAGGFVKQVGVSYLYSFRRLHDDRPPAQLNWLYLEARDPAPVGQEHQIISLDPFGGIASTAPTGRPIALHWYPRTLLGGGAIGQSLDGEQPYKFLFGVTPDQFPSYQELTNSLPGNYGSIRVPVKPPPAGNKSLVLMSVQPIGGGASLPGSFVTMDRDTAMEGEPLPGGWRLVQLYFSELVAIVGGGTRYRLALGFSPAAAEGIDEWLFGVLTASAGTENLTYNGTQDAGVLAGVRSTALDYPWTINRVAPGPAEPVATAGVTETYGGAGGCQSTLVAHVELSWDRTFYGLGFGKYLVERYDGLDGRWRSIATIEDEAQVTYRDDEARFAVETLYRVRVIDSYGSLSNPATTATTAIVLEPPGPGYVFSAAGRTDLLVAYTDVYGTGRPERTFEPIDGDPQLQPIFGRDGQVALRPTERQGVRFTRSLLLTSLFTHEPGVDAAGRLAEAARADVAYICVRDEVGGRWFSALSMPSVTVTQAKAIHLAQITVTEIGFEPFVQTFTSVAA